jgi:hypothetical protein
LNHPTLDRLIAACRADERVIAAFMSGSRARGAADEHSDFDLGLITTDDAYDDFLAGRADFIRRLGEPVFVEDFDLPETVFFILSDGTEAELAVGRESSFTHIARGPYTPLLDKKDLLAGVAFSGRQPEPQDQREALRRLIVWFWHDLSHFMTAIARGQLWWAYGQLETLRRSCVNLTRLQHDFQDPNIGPEPYFKVEQVLPADQLRAFEATISPTQRQPMLAAARALVQFYCELAPDLAAAHNLTYPTALERLMLARFEPLLSA